MPFVIIQPQHKSSEIVAYMWKLQHRTERERTSGGGEFSAEIHHELGKSNRLCSDSPEETKRQEHVYLHVRRMMGRGGGSGTAYSSQFLLVPQTEVISRRGGYCTYKVTTRCLWRTWFGLAQDTGALSFVPANDRKPFVPQKGTKTDGSVPQLYKVSLTKSNLWLQKQALS